MDSNKVGWLLALSVSAMLAGCGDRHERPWADKAVESRAPRTSASGLAAVAAPSVVPVVTSAPVADSSVKPKSQGDRFQVKRVVLASGVKNREPIDPSTSFDVGQERVYAFVEVDNPDRTEGSVFVSFVPPKGAAHGPIELEVGAAPRWRTWAYTRAATRPGTWKAVVKNARGKVLAESEFEVGSPEPFEGRPVPDAQPGA
jgi:hypothetical protein